LIGSPYEAARCVSLLGCEERRAADDERVGVWSDIHTFLARGYGETAGTFEWLSETALLTLQSCIKANGLFFNTRAWDKSALDLK
jgi:hypothetical protein